MTFLDFHQVLAAAWQTPLYRRKYAGLSRSRATADGEAIPFLEPADLLTEDPLSLIGPRVASARTAFFSSGTHGRPKVVFFSGADLERLFGVCARLFEIEGVRPGDRALLVLPMNLWSVGQISLRGLERAGAQVLPVNTQTPRSVWQVAAREFPCQVLSSTPSVLADLATMDLGLPPQRIVETTGEPLPPTQRRALQEHFGGTVHDAYGLTECVVGTECRAQDGYHIVPGSVRVEIVSRTTGRAVPEGQVGEIVVTSLMQELMPIVRYRTKDLGILNSAPCSCGYPSLRLKVVGRAAETLFLPAGVKVTNLEVLEVLAPFSAELIPRPRLRARRAGGGAVALDLSVPARDPTWVGTAPARRVEEELRARLEHASLDVADILGTGDLEIGVVEIVAATLEDLQEHRKPMLQLDTRDLQ